MANEADRVKYRRLNVGEVIEAGDEYQSEETKVWTRVPVIIVGKVIDKDHLPLRRLCLCGAQPSQQRDLPEVVADLRERVARLEAAQATLGSGDEIARLTAERDAAIRERDAAKEECERLRQSVRDTARVRDFWHQLCATREEELKALKARVAELERDRRPATWQEEEAAVELAWLLCGLEPYWPSDEPGTIVRHAESMRREVGRLRDRVAELEAAAAPAANAGGDDAVVVPQTVVAGNFAQIHWNTCCRLHRMAMDKAGVRWTQSTEPSRPESEEAGNAGGEKQEPVAWGVLMTPGSKVWRCSSEKQAQKCVDHFGTGTVVPLYAAPQPRRGWLTEEERELIAGLADDDVFTEEGQNIAKALLARETPPRVKVPHFDDLEADARPVWQSACEAWIAAIRDAGGEVADE